MKKSMKTLKVFEKDRIIDFQTVIEEVIGNYIAQLSIYDGNWDKKSIINGVKVERDRAYFVPDADYELIIRKKK